MHRTTNMLVAMAYLSATVAAARADIFQWEYINPGDPAQGKQQSSTLCLDGAGVVAGPSEWIRGRNVTKAYLRYANLASASFYLSNLSDAYLNGANLAQADLNNTTVTGADFSQTNLDHASFYAAILTGANFSGAEIRWARFSRDSFTANGTGLTPAQLYTTASYLASDLTGVGLYASNLAGVNFSGQILEQFDIQACDLTGANFTNARLNYTFFANAVLAGADFTGAQLTFAYFENVTQGGFTPAQLYSTASYKARDSYTIYMDSNDLTAWNFTGQKLTGSTFTSSTLIGANFSAAQLNSVDFREANLTGANLSGANLSNTSFYEATLAGANFTGADVRWGTYHDTTSRGFTAAQLYSTVSYLAYDLREMGWGQNDLRGWNFAGQYLVNGYWSGALLTGADFSGADLRGFNEVNLVGATTTNLIRTDGHINGLDLSSGRLLRVRDYDILSLPPMTIPVTVDQQFTMGNGTLRIMFEGDKWDSIISFAPGIPVALGGTLELTFAPGADPTSQIGRTYDVFDWTAVNPMGAFAIASPYAWDLSSLYTTGDVTLLATTDFNGDKLVDGDDLAHWQGDFGLNGESDADNDGDSDGADFLAWQRQLGLIAPAVSASATAPEPPAIVLILLAAIGIRRVGSRMRQQLVSA